ncbi:MAG TPA: GNAT family protein [Pyrinomonadaceae bacterium]|nr:GNAT family protein [Pyrinomonadaceae bacterium]
MDFKLRKWKLSDLEIVAAYGCNPKITKFMSDAFPDSVEKWRKFLEFSTTVENNLYFAIEINGKAVGAIGVSLQTGVLRKNAELGYWLGEDFWGNGIITEAIREIVQIAFEKHDIVRIFAKPFETNIASHKALEKAGFKLEARFEKIIFKNGEFLDELIYAIRRK